MRVARWLGRWAGAGLWLVALAPALALGPSAVLDRGPDGSARTTLFPAAMAALDPFLWECARNSLMMAVAVTAASLLIGVGLARMTARARFWGRPILVALAVAPAVIPTVAPAIGLRLIAGPVGWLGWFWVGISGGVPLVMLASGSALARVPDAWEDAARLAGASRAMAWRQLIWPVVRPSAARGAAAVFTITLAEPGAALLLGLRRTLAFQLVEAASGPEPAPRVAVLGLATLLMAVAAQVLLGWWGGPSVVWSLERSKQPAGPSGMLRLAFGVLALGVWIVFAWLPALAVLARFAPRALLADPVAARLIGNAAALGLAVVALDLALAWTLSAWAGRRPGLAHA